MITVFKDGAAVSPDITWVTMSVMARGTKMVQHQVEGAEEDFLLYRGRNSAQGIINGYCHRNPLNEEILDNLCDGSVLTIDHSLSGVHHVKATSWSPGPTGTFIHFTMNVTSINQDEEEEE